MSQTVDIAVSDRPVKAETGALADWVNRECVPLLKALRDAVNGLDVDGTTPGGAAGGQLDGTYPDPSVVGLTESGGPTALTMGAVADGQFLQRSGATVVGGSVTAETVTMAGFRSEDQGGAYVANTSRIHWAGLNSRSSAGAWIGAATTSSLLSIGAGQMAYAYPDTFDYAVIINRLLTRTNGKAGAGDATIKLGVYADTTLASGSFAGSHYPGALLGSSGNLTTSAANTLLETAGLTIAIAAALRVWFVWVCTNATVSGVYTVPAYRSGVLLPINGFTMNVPAASTIADDNATGAGAWRHAITYTGSEALPDPFPTSAPAMATSNTDLVLPAVGYGRQAA